MLANLQPTQAAHVLTERVKRFTKQNQEIADWLQERRRVEEAYVQGLRKLLVFKIPNAQSELGVFQSPWDKILQSTDAIAASHHRFAQDIEKDVEHSLRSFQNKREMQNIHTVSQNLQQMARDLEDAQEQSDKLTRKGKKANVQKVDHATSRLESVTQQWESQAPFIFESLQALDEQRINHLRDVLTQYVTHEVDQAARTQASAEEVLNNILEVKTEQEVQRFVHKTVGNRPKLEKRPTGTGTGTAPATINSRQGSVATPGTPTTPSLAPPSLSGHEDDGISEHSGPKEGGESKLRRLGTMLGRAGKRRQSVHGGFGQLGHVSPQRNLGTFSRSVNSRDGAGNNLGGLGRGISPRGSSHNLSETHHRLSSLAETEAPVLPPQSPDGPERTGHEGTNGLSSTASVQHAESQAPSTTATNGLPADILDVPPPAGPPPSQMQHNTEAQEHNRDADGFTERSAMNDPISMAQKEAAAENGEDGEQAFNVRIQKEPVAEEDADAKQAALSNVAKSLTMLGAPTRKTGTVRGRRDVRNTVYMPSLSAPSESVIPENNTISETTSFQPSPTPGSPVPGMPSRPSAVSALMSESSITGSSDTQSVRSGMSLGTQAQHRHPELREAGLNTSIIEYVSSSFEDGVVKSAKINGEIAFSYNPDQSSSNPDQVTVKINNYSALSAIGPNRIVVNDVASAPDEYMLDLSHLTKPSPSFTYKVQADDGDLSTLAAQCPLVIKPAWKPTGDKLGLVLQYRLNPETKLPKPVTLHDVFILATYEGARASGAQSKPSSTHLKDKHVVYWRLGDVTLTEDWGRIVCRIIGEGGAEPKPGHIEARWSYTLPADSVLDDGTSVGSGISISRLAESKGKERATEEDDDDPFADDKGPVSPALRDTRTWVDVPTVRKLASGKYEAR